MLTLCSERHFTIQVIAHINKGISLSVQCTRTQGLLRKGLVKAEKWVKAQNDDGSDDYGRNANRILFETFERCSTVDLDKVEFQMLEPCVVFKWMLTSVQLEMVEIAAKTLSTAPGITQAKVMPPEEGLALLPKGQRKPDARSAALF